MSDSDGIDFPHRAGTPGEATPAQAERWLERWHLIGGGIAIARDRRVNPWRIIPAGLTPETRALMTEMQTVLLRELDDTPGLAAAIRVVVSTAAMIMLRRGLIGMGKEPL